MPTRDEDVRAYVAERDAAFRRGDIAWVKNLLGTDSDSLAEAALHKARYEVPAMGKEIREASRKWLEERGLTRMGGLPFPPPGVLEE